MRLELLDDTVLPSTFNEPPTSKGATSIAKSIVAAPEDSSANEDAEKRSNMLTAEAVCAEDRVPGSATKAFNDDADCVASAASVTAVLVLEFRNASAFALIESSTAVLPLAAVYIDDNDPATFETSRF